MLDRKWELDNPQFLHNYWAQETNESVRLKKIEEEMKAG